MLSFFQLYEMLLENNIQYPEFTPSNKHREDIKNLLTGQPKEIIVRFALHCAEDVLKFNSDQTMEAAQNCIDLVKKWLKSSDEERKVLETDLRAAANAAWAYANEAWAAANDAFNTALAVANANVANAAYYAAVYAGSAVRAAAHAVRAATNDADDAGDAGDAAYASAYAADSDDQYQPKINEYKAFANSLRSTVPNFNNPLYLAKELNPQNPYSIYIFIDELQDHGIDIIIQDGQNYKINNPQLTITGKTPTELYNKIANDSKSVTWLMSLANNLNKAINI